MHKSVEAVKPGLPDLSLYSIPKRKKYTKLPQNKPNVLKFLPTSSIARPSKNCPNADFRF
jgi:hypothetical protein